MHHMISDTHLLSLFATGVIEFSFIYIDPVVLGTTCMICTCRLMSACIQCTCTVYECSRKKDGWKMFSWLLTSLRLRKQWAKIRNYILSTLFVWCSIVVGNYFVYILVPAVEKVNCTEHHSKKQDSYVSQLHLFHIIWQANQSFR